MKYIVLSILGFAITILSCNTSVEPPVVTTYPFASGNTWNYKVEYSVTNFRPTRPGATFTEVSITWTAIVSSPGDSLVRDSVTTSRLSLVENIPDGFPGIPPGALRSDKFYLLRNDSLYLYASLGFSTNPILPKRSPNYSLLFNGKIYRNGFELSDLIAGRLYSLPVISTDTLYYISPPGIVYVFPFRQGTEWLVTNSFIHIKKKITGVETVTTEAGAFSTYVVEWVYEDMSGLIIKEYVNDKGLIKRSVTFKDITITSSENPEGYGVADFKFEYNVTSLNVH